MKNLVRLFIITFLFSACSDNLNLNNEIGSLDSNRDLKEILSGFSDQYAIFKSENELSDFIIHFNTLSDSEKEEIIIDLPFITISQVLKDFYEEIPTFTRAQQFYDLVEESNGLLQIEQSPDGDSEVVEIGLSDHDIWNFLNNKMIVKVGNEYFKYYNQYRISSVDANELDRINSIESVHNSNLGFELAYEELFTYDGFMRINDIGQTIKDEVVKNEPWCKNDRRLRYRARIGRNFASSSSGITGHWLYAYVKLRPATKGIPCIWYNYTTRVICEDFHHQFKYTIIDGEVIQPEVLFDWVEPDYDGETNQLHFEIQLPTIYNSNSEIANGVPFVEYYEAWWTKRYLDGTSRGIDPLWMNIDWAL